MRKLAAIYNLFDGTELLDKSIQTIYPHVDMVVIVYQDVSNFGEKCSPLPVIEKLQFKSKVELIKYEPDLNQGGGYNERLKRNIGLYFARKNKCTHFLAMDCDELYEDFFEAKELYFKSGARGSVLRLRTYFKKPTFMFDIPEDYYVPFIHEIDEETRMGFSSYPFWVDPTRTVNQNNIVLLPTFMHHFSWCRKDIMLKARNSSANGHANNLINNKIIFEDYNSPDLGEGFYVRNWNRTIKEVPDTFGLSRIFA